ncbi:MAG: MFS transporter [Halofilum sp. (in: g-proteobacteria)]|nr:MFS transporter [Halofilum sp. (in: g-proteobacteria)]
MNTGRRQGTVAVLVAGAAMLGLSMGLRQTYGLFLEPITGEIAISHAGFGLAIAAQNLIWGLLTPLCGMLGDRYGTGRVLAGGGLLYVLGLLLMAAAETPLGIHLGAGLLTGIAVSATGFPLVLGAVARHAPEGRRSTWLGLAAAGGSLGQFLLLPATQGLIAGFGWSSALLALAGLAAAMLLLAAPLRGRPAAATGFEQSLGEAFTEARRHRGFLLLTTGFFVCGFHVAFVATHLPAYVGSQGLSAWVGATALGVIGFFNIIGTFGAGWLGERYRKKHLLAGMYLGRAGVIGLMLLLPMSEATIWFFAIAFGLLWLGTVPLTSALVGQIFGPRYLSTLFGIVMLSHQLGAFCGAWLGGISFDLTGSYQAVWLAAIGLGLAAAALHWPIPDQPLVRAARAETV